MIGFLARNKPLVASYIDVITYNHGEKLRNNVKKSSKIRQDEKTLTSVFAASTEVLFLEGRLGTTLFLHPFLRFSQFFLFLQILSLKACRNLRNNSRIRFFELDIMYHFPCGDQTYTKILKCFIILCPQPSLSFLVPAPISGNFKDTKMILEWFSSVVWHWIKRYQRQTNVSWVAKQYLVYNL